MAAAPTTVSPNSARSQERRPLRREALPSLVRVLVGLGLLAVSLAAWVGGQWFLTTQGWDDGARVSAAGTVVASTTGEELVVWVPRASTEEAPRCRANDPVFDQRLAVQDAAGSTTRTVAGEVYESAATLTAGSSQVVVSCTEAAWIAPAPQGPAALREGRWTVLLAMALGVAGVLLLGRELLGTELTAPVRARAT